MVAGQAQPGLYLGAVVAGVQDTPPEHPDPLSLQAAEEGTALEPPGGGALRQLRQASPGLPDVPVEVGPDDGAVALREKVLDGRLVGADKLGEEAAFGEELVDQDGAD